MRRSWRNAAVDKRSANDRRQLTDPSEVFLPVTSLGKRLSNDAEEKSLNLLQLLFTEYLRARMDG